MEQGRDAVGRMLHEPLLNSRHTVAQHVGFYLLLTGILRKMAYTVGYQLAALVGVQTSLLVEEVVHIHAAQLGDTFLLGHPIVKFIDCLFHIHVMRLLAGPQQGRHSNYIK